MQPAPASDLRRAGVLLHPTSLPGALDGGVLGPDADRFVDFLAAAGLTVWQTLPLGPVADSLSPYQSPSAFAGNPRLIDPADLVALGAPGDPARWADRAAMFAPAWRGFRDGAASADRAAFRGFWERERGWLLPYALFRICRQEHGDGGWWTWPEAVRNRQNRALMDLIEGRRDQLREIAFEQFLFDRQWLRLRQRARERGIRLFGDIPIYVDLDSADVWWHRPLFRVDEAGRPEAVAGVPPDYFSADGQVWGNPLFNWARMEEGGFAWWVARVRRQLAHFDLLRLDHFRGLQAYWEIPPGESTARNGRWCPAPGAALLARLRAELGGLPLVAEDLGTITPEVTALRTGEGLPGMLVLEFAFDGRGDNPYLPRNHVAEAVVYPGTHDNETLAGWAEGIDGATRAYVCEVLRCPADAIPAAVLKATWASPAFLAIASLQDLIGLDNRARMNTPGTVTGNWNFRFDWGQVPASLAHALRHDLAVAGRLPGLQAPVAGSPAASLA